MWQLTVYVAHSCGLFLIDYFLIIFFAFLLKISVIIKISNYPLKCKTYVTNTPLNFKTSCYISILDQQHFMCIIIKFFPHLLLNFIYPFEQNRFTKLSYLGILLRWFVSRLFWFEFIWCEEIWWKNQFGVLVDNFVALCDCEDSSLCKANCETVNLPGCDGSVKNALLSTNFVHSQPNFWKCPLRELSHTKGQLTLRVLLKFRQKLIFSFPI